MQKISKFSMYSVFLVTLFFSGFFLFSVKAADLTISKPVADERLTGVNTIRWSVFNTGISEVPYDLSLRDATCTNGFSISGGNFSQKVQNGNYTTDVDTRTVSDGRACIRLCVFDTSQCTYRMVNIVNYSNNPPVITNYPAKVEYTVNEVFEHTVEYFDPDGDTAYLQLLVAPRFLVLEQDGFSTIGEYFTPGEYFVSFIAIDNLGASSQQTFTLYVKAIPTPTPISVTKTTTPTPTSIPTDWGNISFLSPDETSVFSGEDNMINWDFSEIDTDSIDEVDIFYSTADSDDFVEVYKYMGGVIASYNWNVSDIDDGDYKLKIIFFNSKGDKLHEIVSDVFKIDNLSLSEAILAVVDMSPSNKSEIEELRPIISAKFSPSSGGEIIVDKVRIELDGKNISKECSIDTNGFKCELSDDLKTGTHTVSVELQDTNDQKTKQEWVFSIKEQNEESGNGEEKVNFWNTYILPLWEKLKEGDNNLKYLYLCCGSLLILLLFIFVVRSMNRKKLYSEQVSEFNSQGNLSSSSSTDSVPPINDGFSNDSYDFSVGSHDVIEDNEPVSTVEPEGPITADIPDWLKGEEYASSNPVDSTGQVMDMQGQNTDQSMEIQSQVHESFDLASSNGDNNDQSLG